MFRYVSSFLININDISFSFYFLDFSLIRSSNNNNIFIFLQCYFAQSNLTIFILRQKRTTYNRHCYTNNRRLMRNKQEALRKTTKIERNFLGIVVVVVVVVVAVIVVIP